MPPPPVGLSHFHAPVPPHQRQEQDFQRWLHERMIEARPKEELHVLGSQGAYELEQARQRLKNLVFNLHNVTARKGEGPIQHHDLPEGFTGWTPEMEQIAKQAGVHVGLPGRILRGAMSAPELAQFAAEGHTDHPWMAGIEYASLFPLGRPLRAIRAGVAAGGALRLGLGREGARAAAEAVRTGPSVAGTVLRSTFRGRILRAGDHAVTIPAARSRTGRVVEQTSDFIRRHYSDKIPGLKSEPERALEETARMQKYRNRVPEAKIRRLEQIGHKLNDGQEYAIRLHLEQSTPEEALAHHRALAVSAEFDQQRLYHQMHEHFIQQASKYLRVAANGTVELRPNLPRYMREADTLMQQVAAGREDIYREMNLLSDKSIADRISAPGRVRRGARFVEKEQLLRDALQTTPIRAQIEAQAREVAARMTDDPERQRIAVDAAMSLWESNVRKAAETTFGDQQEFERLLQHLHVGGGMTEVPHDALTQGGGFFEDNIPKVMRDKLDAATVHLAWADEPIQDVAKRYNVGSELLREYAARNGEKLTGRILSNKEWWPGGADAGTHLYQLADLTPNLPGFPVSQIFKAPIVDLLDTLPDKFGTQEIIGRLKKAGIKDEEIQYSGLDKFLEGEGKSTSKEAVAAWLDENYLRLEENVRDEAPGFVDTGAAPEDQHKFETYTLAGHDSLNYREWTIRLPESRYGQLFKQEAHFPEWNILVHARLSDHIVDGKPSLMIEEIQSDWHQAAQKQGYTANYRETEEFKAAQANQAAAEDDFNKVIERFDNPDMWTHMDIPAMDSATRMLQQIRSSAVSYRGWEFRTARVESRWGTIADHVVEGKPPNDNTWLIVSGVDSMGQSRKNAELWSRFAKMTPDQADQEISRIIDLRRAAQNIQDWEQRLRHYAETNRYGIPDAPFKKNWHELAFKRMLREAVDNGYERLAWTTGQQQANRYELANFFSRIEIEPSVDHESYQYQEELARFVEENSAPEPDPHDFEDPQDYEVAYSDWESHQENEWSGLVEEFDREWDSDNDQLQIHAWKPGTSLHSPADHSEEISPEDLVDYIGPDLAEKYHNGGQRIFEGKDLAVGENAKSAYGAAQFYDKKLVGFANKYLKKFGISTELRPLGTPRNVQVWSVTDHLGKNLRSFPTNKLAADYRKELLVAFPERKFQIQIHIEQRFGMKRRFGEASELEFHGQPVHSIDLTNPELKRFLQEGQALFQRGGSLSGIGPFGVKGAIVYTGPAHAVESTIRFSEHADLTTFVHEIFGHWSPQWLPEADYRSMARWAGGNFDPARGPIDRAAAEKVARGMEAYIREGVGPTPVKQAVASLAPYFREMYDGADLPDLTPQVRKVFERMFAHERPIRGGQLVGAEDIGPVGIARVPTIHGRPLPTGITSVHRRVAAMTRYILSGGQVVGKGATDKALHKEYRGAALMSGYFTPDAIKPTARDAFLAVRLATVHRVREALIKAGSELPTDYSDFAVKIDPDKTTPKAVKYTLDRMREIDAKGGKLTRKDLADIDFSILEEGGRDVMPASIEMPDGSIMDTREAAKEILNSQQPIDNIRWVPRDWIDKSGLAPTKGMAAMQALRGHKGANLGLETIDAINDLQKIMVLYLNPAYIPINLVGNLVMNVMQQGVFTPVNLWRSALAHQWLDGWERKAIDNAMGNGLTASLAMKSGPGQFIHNTLGFWINQAVDLVPRRAAWMHEARNAGFKSKEAMRDLIRRADAGDKQAVEDMAQIAYKANDAIVDYERMSPIEREITSRVIFFYPWLKGATRYTMRFGLEHPVQATALMLAAEHGYTVQRQDLGAAPSYESTDVPLSAKSVGLQVGIPGIYDGRELGNLGQVFGDGTWRREGNPMVVDARQLFTFTTPLDIYRAGYGFVTGDPNTPQLVDNLTPFLGAASVALSGYDPFRNKEVPSSIGTFLKQLEDVPQRQRWQELAPASMGGMTAEERRQRNENAINPRSREESFWRLIGSGLAPTQFSTQVAAKRVLSDAPTKVRHEVELTEGAKKYGLGPVTDEIKKQQQEYDDFNHEITAGMKADEKLRVALKYLDRHPHVPAREEIHQRAREITTQAQADGLYEAIRARLRYFAWRDYTLMHLQIEHGQKRDQAKEKIGG